ncbi:hypothetical protein ACLOJK_009893 [Asimina triloba]
MTDENGLLRADIKVFNFLWIQLVQLWLLIILDGGAFNEFLYSQVLNMIIEDLFQWHPISQRKLKELLGHTPSQVFAGALLGILVACFCCQGCLIAGAKTPQKLRKSGGIPSHLPVFFFSGVPDLPASAPVFPTAVDVDLRKFGSYGCRLPRIRQI